MGDTELINNYSILFFSSWNFAGHDIISINPETFTSLDITLMNIKYIVYVPICNESYDYKVEKFNDDLVRINDYNLSRALLIKYKITELPCIAYISTSHTSSTVLSADNKIEIPNTSNHNNIELPSSSMELFPIKLNKNIYNFHKDDNQHIK